MSTELYGTAYRVTLPKDLLPSETLDEDDAESFRDCVEERLKRATGVVAGNANLVAAAVPIGGRSVMVVVRLASSLRPFEPHKPVGNHRLRTILNQEICRILVERKKLQARLAKKRRKEQRGEKEDYGRRYPADL